MGCCETQLEYLGEGLFGGNLSEGGYPGKCLGRDSKKKCWGISSRGFRGNCPEADSTVLGVNADNVWGYFQQQSLIIQNTIEQSKNFI